MTKILSQRGSMIAKIHIAKKDLGLDDDTYRSIIMQTVGKDSSSKCTDKQLDKVLRALKAKGWKNANNQKKKTRSAPSPLIKKIYALWGALQQIGEINTTEKTALDSFVKKHTGVDYTHWVDSRQAVKIIEILKKWKERVENDGNDIHQ